MMPLAGLCFVYAQRGESLKMSRGSLLRLTHKGTVLATVKITSTLRALLTFSDGGKKKNSMEGRKKMLKMLYYVYFISR